MVFHRAKVKNHDDVILSNTNLDRVVYTKFLGVIIDDKLNFVNHIAYIKNKISKGMGIIYKARKFLNKSILVNLYNSFVYPYLIYCIEVWGNVYNIHLEPLLKLQRKIVR